MVPSSQAMSQSDNQANIHLGISPILRNAEPYPNDEKWAGYNALILLVSLIAIGMLAIGVVVELTPSARSLLAYADLFLLV